MEKITNYLMDLSGKIDPDNPIQIAVLAILILIVGGRYMGYLIEMDIEKVFLPKKNKTYERIVLSIIYFLLYMFAYNVLYQMMLDMYGNVVAIYTILCAVFTAIDLIAFMKIPSTKVNNKLFLISPAMIFFGLFLLGIMFSNGNADENQYYQMLILISIVCAFLSTYFEETTLHFAEKRIVFKKLGEEDKYYYVKINDEYLLCGDTKERKKATRIEPLLISKILDGEYVMAYTEEKDDTTVVKTDSSEKESAEEYEVSIPGKVKVRKVKKSK